MSNKQISQNQTVQLFLHNLIELVELCPEHYTLAQHIHYISEHTKHTSSNTEMLKAVEVYKDKLEEESIVGHDDDFFED